MQELNYAYVTTAVDGAGVPERRFTHGTSLDGKGEYHLRRAEPLGQEPKLAPPMPEGYAQKEQMSTGGISGVIENIKDAIAG